MGWERRQPAVGEATHPGMGKGFLFFKLLQAFKSLRQEGLLLSS